MSDDREGPRMDEYALSSDGTQRDLFDPKLSADDFKEWMLKRLGTNTDLPSVSLGVAQALIISMRQCVAMFNDAFEYEDDGEEEEDADDGT